MSGQEWVSLETTALEFYDFEFPLISYFCALQVSPLSLCEICQKIRIEGRLRKIMALNRQSIFHFQDEVRMPTDLLLLPPFMVIFSLVFTVLIILSEWFLALEALAPR